MSWRLACQIAEATVAFERTVSFADADGVEQELQVDAGNLVGVTALRVYPVLRQGDRVLVALPAETSAGHRRVWVRARDLVPDELGLGHDPVRP